MATQPRGDGQGGNAASGSAALPVQHQILSSLLPGAGLRTPYTGLDLPVRLPQKTSGFVLIALVLVVFAVAYGQFRGVFTSTSKLTLIATRAGLLMDQGSKVTYNGVRIGRVSAVDEVTVDGQPRAKIVVAVDPAMLRSMPANITTSIEASTVFGAKYVAFRAPKDATAQRLSPDKTIDITAVSTEVNTLFETITSIAEKVDPVQLNAALTATAQGLDGLGNKLGNAIVEGNGVLGQLNDRMPQLRNDIRKLADVAGIYADASPDLWKAIDRATVTSATLVDQTRDLDAALIAAAGFGNAGEHALGPAAPFLVRGQADLVPTAQLLDTYSPEFFCFLRNSAQEAAASAASAGGNGYSAETLSKVVFPGNPYVYPDNLPRINGKGGPLGRPGCWAPISRDRWPAPLIVMDDGASAAPYNHLGLGQPLLTDFVWGRQIGENTINP